MRAFATNHYLMKSLIILLTAFITSSCVNAQRQELDSLLLIFKLYTKEDTTRLNLMTDIAFNYYSINADSGLSMAKQAVLLAKKLNNKSNL